MQIFSGMVKYMQPTRSVSMKYYTATVDTIM